LEFYDDYHICVDWSVVAYPKTNGQVERANGMILQGLKPRIFNRLNKFGRKWLAKLPLVIWSLRRTPSRATGSMPFLWSMGPRLSSPQIFNMAPLELEPTTSREIRPAVKKHWTS
jgi:hypothetical protein